MIEQPPDHAAAPDEHSGEREAFLRLCEALGLSATAGAYLEGARLVSALAEARAKLAFVLKNGPPMTRGGKFRYHGVAEPFWHDTQEAAIDTAMVEFGAKSASNMVKDGFKA